MKKEEAKWYEKASGKKQHKAENSAKFAAKNELKKQRKEEKTQKNEAKTEDKKTPQKKVNVENRRKNNFSQNKSSKTVPMFELKNIPADSLEILKNFGKIVAETRNLSPKQQVLLPKQIKN